MSNIHTALRSEAYAEFFQLRQNAYLRNLSPEIQSTIQKNLNPLRNVHLSLWKNIIAQLPNLNSNEVQLRIKNGVVELVAESSALEREYPCALNQPRLEYSLAPAQPHQEYHLASEQEYSLALNQHAPEQERPEISAHLKPLLKQLVPWRKGPYNIFNVFIDSEWKSNLKWDRVQKCIPSLEGKRVLDIGSANGYYLWRMHEAGAQSVVGLEPHLLNIAQFSVLQAFLPRIPVAVLPLSDQEFPQNCRLFDTVFSMGVYYHRKNPIEHLLRCKSYLQEGGQLVLETLVIDGSETTVLCPRNRYAKMRNVWTIPSALHLARVLERCGFMRVQLHGETITSPEEQRSTEWMNFESLIDFLDPQDMRRTVEGYPAPKRAIITATAP